MTASEKAGQKRDITVRLRDFWPASVILDFLDELGAMTVFGIQVIIRIPRSPFEIREFMFQLYQVGVRSVSIVLVAGFFVGGIAALQFNHALSLFQAEVYLGGITTSGLLREIGPVLVAIMITGRIGAYIAAELGTMKVTEQVDAVRCLGADPIQCLVVPRFLAVTIMIFLLTIFGLIVSLVGGALLSNLLLDVNISYYLVNLVKLTTVWALINAMIKSVLFGIVISVICCFKGMSAEGGAQGVGRAVNSTLVVASIAVFLIDYIIASINSLTFRLAESFLFGPVSL
jgi:phospholipid/cholesterol/gamma-HCH transport system permease protein